jgi:hypothetical protein
MHDPSPVIVVVMLLVFLAVMRKSGGAGWRIGQRRMEEMIAEMREERKALPRNVPTLDQVQMLEDRVRVLERIVTDQNYSLARDIEALRDPKDRRQNEEKI